MDNTIYSAEFAKKLCDEYHLLTNRINRSIKEAVRYGRYETNLVLATDCYDYAKIVKCIDYFKDLGYDVSIQTENCFLDDSVEISISWR